MNYRNPGGKSKGSELVDERKSVLEIRVRKSLYVAKNENK